MMIEGREIGPDQPPFIVCELGCNHNGSLAEGKKLIDTAMAAGASAIKLQCYTADTLTFRGDGDEFKILDGPWRGQTLYDLYSKAQTPRELITKLISYGQKKGVIIFSSVFALEDVEFLADLGVPAFKIASFELTDIPLIQKVAGTGLPVIISTGMGSTSEIKDAINAFNQFSAKPENLCLLHCVSAYPATPKESNLPALGPLSELGGRRGGYLVGLSDHTLGVGVAAAAISFGANIVEKHFTLDRMAGGPDAGFSLEPAEFALLVKTCNEAWEAIQPCQVQPRSKFVQFRKSLYVVKDVSSGEAFSEKNVRAIRPASGLAPCFYPSVLGAVATSDLKAGTPLQKSMVSTLI